jgi:hypothetical protein
MVKMWIGSYCNICYNKELFKQVPLSMTMKSLNFNWGFLINRIYTWRMEGRLLAYQEELCSMDYLFVCGLCPSAALDSELTFETVNPFRHTGRTPWTGDRPIEKLLRTQDRITQKKRGHISMPWARFENTIQEFERSKFVSALDVAVIGTGCKNIKLHK